MGADVWFLKCLSVIMPMGGQAAPSKAGEWRKEWGNGYSPDFKARMLKPLLDDMDSRRKLGGVLADIGSGCMRSKNGESGYAYYPSRGKTVVRVDIGMPYPYRVRGNTLELQADVESLELDSVAQRRRLALLSRHLSTPKGQVPRADTIILSDILNYVDFRRVISGLLRFLRPGGRMVICNTPGMGFPDMFSDHGVKGNNELAHFIRSRGMFIEHLTHVPNVPFWMPLREAPWSGYGTVEQAMEHRNMMLVAVACGQPAYS